MLDLPFTDQRFALAVCINTLHHIYPSDQPKALSELARITSRYLLLEIKHRENVLWLYSYQDW